MGSAVKAQREVDYIPYANHRFFLKDHLANEAPIFRLGDQCELYV